MLTKKEEREEDAETNFDEKSKAAKLIKAEQHKIRLNVSCCEQKNEARSRLASQVKSSAVIIRRVLRKQKHTTKHTNKDQGRRQHTVGKGKDRFYRNESWKTSKQARQENTEIL